MTTEVVEPLSVPSRRILDHASASAPRHVAALDGVRGLAVFAVMVFHLAPRPYGHSPLDRAITRIFSMGWIGVDLFFVLSGFLITGILLDAKGSRGYFKTFYARRTLRIFPLYYGLLLALFIALPLFHKSLYEDARADQKWFWLYSANIIDAIKNFPFRSLNHLWSLAVEEQFYLVWPLLVFLTSPGGLVRVCWTCIAVAIISRLFFVFCHSMPFQPAWLALPSPVAAYTLPFCRTDGLSCGALVAISLRYNIVGNSPRFWRSRIAWIAGAVAVVTVMTAAKTVIFSEPIIETAGMPLLAFFFATTVAIAATSVGAMARLFSIRPLVFLGKYSYSLYLFHPLIHGLCKDYFVRSPPRWLFISGQGRAWIAGGAAFILSVTLAWISWHIYEAPLLSLKRFFPSPRLMAGQPALATAAKR